MNGPGQQVSDGLAVARAVEGPVGARLAKAGGVSNQVAAASGAARLVEVRGDRVPGQLSSRPAAQFALLLPRADPPADAHHAQPQ